MIEKGQMSDETSLVSGRFTKLENGGVRVLVLLLVPGRDSRHRETRTIGSDGISVLSSPIGSRSAVASRLRERGGRRGRRSPRRIEKLVPDNTGQTTERTRQTAHGNGLRERTESTDTIGYPVRWSIGRRPTLMRRRPRRRGTASPVRSGPARPPCPHRPRLLAF